MDIPVLVCNYTFSASHSKVHHVRLFAGEDIYSELYLTVCEWHNDHSKIVIFGFK